MTNDTTDKTGSTYQTPTLYTSGTSITVDPGKILKAIDDRLAVSAEAQKRLTTSQELVDGLVAKTQDAMAKTGSLYGDLKAAVTERDFGYVRRMMTRIPGLKRLAGKKGQYLSLSDAIKQSLGDVERGLTGLEAQVEPFGDYHRQQEETVHYLLGERKEATERFIKYKQQLDDVVAELTPLESAHKEKAAGKQKSAPYFKEEEKRLQLQSERRRLETTLRAEGRLIDTSTELVDFLGANITTVAAYVDTAGDLIATARRQLQVVGPHLQSQAQLAQLGDTLGSSLQQYQDMRATANGAAVALSMRGAALSRTVQEALGSPFYAGAVVDAVRQLGKLVDSERREDLQRLGQRLLPPTLEEAPRALLEADNPEKKE